MAYFPFMIELEQKPCLVVGGGRVAAHKARQLLEFGACVTVVAPDICEELKNLSWFLEAKEKMILVCRKVQEDDLLGKEVVILATNDSEVNEAYACLCRQKRILVNVVDVKKDCGFYFPAIVRQEDVVIGISTGGCSPLLAVHIKKEIQKSLRPDYGKIAEEMENVRAYAFDNFKTEEARKHFLAEELRKRLEQ